MDIKIINETERFSLRVRGLIKLDDKYLIIRTGEDYFFLPGGHVEIGENTKIALIREIKEEVGIDVNIKNIFCIHEQFYQNKNMNWHENVFYYIVEPTNNIHTKNWETIENDKGILKNLEFIWVNTKELKEIDLRPLVIKDLILSGNTSTITHIIS